MTATRRKTYRWFVVDHDRKDAVVRGPYKHEETAEVARKLLEEFWKNKEWNLWVRRKEVVILEEQVKE